jgi:HEAT repeat protein
MAPSIRRAALAALAPALGLVLASCAPADDVEALFHDLGNPDLEVRLDAQEKLAEIMRAGRHRSFLRALESDDLLVRANSIVFLGQMPQPKARRALRSLLAVERRMMLPYNPVAMEPSRESSDSRVLVASLFRRTGIDPEAIDTLLRGASVDQDPEIVVGTCLAIGVLGDARGVPFLAAATEHRDEAVVRASVEALGHVGGPEALTVLETRIEHPVRVVRIDVLSALERWPRADAAGAIRAIGSGDPDPGVRSLAIEILSNPGGDNLVPWLIERLGDSDAAVRAAAAAALRRLTGQSLGDGAEAWRAWWAKAGGAARGES